MHRGFSVADRVIESLPVPLKEDLLLGCGPQQEGA